jgi:hypothetical protein
MPFCITCVWAGVDSASEQRKLEATPREILENSGMYSCIHHQSLAPTSAASTECIISLCFSGTLCWARFAYKGHCFRVILVYVLPCVIARLTDLFQMERQ